METKAQNEVYSSMLERLIKSPVNLYHDITPISRILGYFNSDIHVLDAHMFRMAQQMIKIQMTLSGNCFITLVAIP